MEKVKVRTTKASSLKGFGSLYRIGKGKGGSTKRTKFQEKIMRYIGAGYPCLLVETKEDFRAENEIEVAVQDENLSYGEWKVTDGWIVDGKRREKIIGVDKDTGQTITQPFTCYKEAIQEIFKMGEGVYVMVGLHYYFKDPTLIQLIKDITWHNKMSKKTLIVVSPVVDIPPELNSEINILSFDVPTKGELSGLVKTINPDPKQCDGITEALMGMDMLEAENAMYYSTSNGVTNIKEIKEQKRQILSKSTVLEYYPAVDIGEVAGHKRIIDHIKKRKLAFSPEARKYNLPKPRGLVLVGITGTGKSLLCKSISSIFGCDLIRWDISKVKNKYVGESGRLMRSTLKELDAIGTGNNMTVVWIDEIEKCFGGVNDETGVTMDILGLFLTWKVETKANVYVVVTSNDVRKLPPELLGKHRFDETFYTWFPTDKERAEAFVIHLKKRDRKHKDFDIMKLVEASEGYTYSEIEVSIEDAMFNRFNEGKELDTEAIVGSLGTLTPVIVSQEVMVEGFKEWVVGKAVPTSSVGIEEGE